MTLLRRFLLYTLAISAMCYFLPLLVTGRDVTHFTENHFIEWSQFALLGATLAVFLTYAIRDRSVREASFLVSGLVTIALFRELDAMLERVIPWLGWKIVFVIVVPLIAWLVLSRTDALRRQVDGFAGSVPFVLGWAGFVLAVPVAQLIGHGPFLEALLGDHYHRAYKHLIEESAELIGYFIVFTAALELHFDPAAVHRIRSPAG